MSDKHTPRTDEQAFVVYPYQIHGQIVGNKAVTVDFARQLETELNETQAVLQQEKEHTNRVYKRLAEKEKGFAYTLKLKHDELKQKDRLIEKLAGALRLLIEPGPVMPKEYLRQIRLGKEALQAYEDAKNQDN